MTPDDLLTAAEQEEQQAEAYVGPERRKQQRPPKPPCAACGRSESAVIDSRPAVADNGVRRKRRCVCGEVFFTLEVFERRAS